jgi:hypothetical protein
MFKFAIKEISMLPNFQVGILRVQTFTKPNGEEVVVQNYRTVLQPSQEVETQAASIFGDGSQPDENIIAELEFLKPWLEYRRNQYLQSQQTAGESDEDLSI